MSTTKHLLTLIIRKDKYLSGDKYEQAKEALTGKQA